MRYIIHNFPSCDLSDEEITGLFCGLDTHIPTNINSTEVELLFQNLLKDIPNIPVKKLRRIKTKFRNSCEELSKLKVPYRHRKIILGLLF